MPCSLPSDYVSNTPNLSAFLPITATIFSYITKIEFFIFCIHPYSLNVLFVLPLKLDKILLFFHEILQNDFSCREKFKTITYLTFIPYLSDFIFYHFPPSSFHISRIGLFCLLCHYFLYLRYRIPFESI